MQGVLAFFGAFNPPTRAHVALAHCAMRQLGAGGVVFVPSQTAYIRDVQGKSHAFSDAARLDMLRAVERARPWARVSDLEIRSPYQPTTYETLGRLAQMGPRPMLLMGSDKLPELQRRWAHAGRIAREYGIACLSRAGDDARRCILSDPFLSGLAPYIRLVDTPPDFRFASSTAVRALCAKDPPDHSAIRALVPEELGGLERWLQGK